jgi:hypothetical protein
MTIVLKVDGMDLSSYVRVQHDAGLDPVNAERIQPQFGGNTAFSDGQPWVRDSAANREWNVPLFMKAASVDALHTLVQTLNSHLFQSAVVEFKPDGATQSTFFDLEAGDLRENYKNFMQAKFWLDATLKLWTRPHGTTGTTRSIASFTTGATYSPSGGPQVFQATGILGDVGAAVNMRITLAALPAPAAVNGHFAAYGFHRSASFVPLRVPSVHLVPNTPTYGFYGASDAIGSQYMGLSIATNFLNQFALQDFVRTDSTFAGRHRVLMVYRHRLTPASALSFRAYFNDPVGQQVPFSAGTVVATVSGGVWQVADLGEVTIPAAASGETLATSYVQLIANTASAAYTGGTQVEVNRLVYIPLDIAAGFAVDASAAWFTGDSIEFRSYPTAVVRQSNASLVRNQNVSALGGAPVLPPLGSPMASGAMTGVALFGKASDFIGGWPVEIGVTVRERFSFFR